MQVFRTYSQVIGLSETSRDKGRVLARCPARLRKRRRQWHRDQTAYQEQARSTISAATCAEEFCTSPPSTSCATRNSPYTWRLVACAVARRAEVSNIIVVLISTGGQRSSTTTPVTSGTHGCPQLIATRPVKRSGHVAASVHANSPPAPSATSNAHGIPKAPRTPITAS